MVEVHTADAFRDTFEERMQNTRLTGVRAGMEPPDPPVGGKRALSLDRGRVEVLVFNVSHVDMVLEVLRPGVQKGSDVKPVIGPRPDRLFARPRFNRYYPLSVKVLEAIRAAGDKAELVQCPFGSSEAQTGADAAADAAADDGGEPLVPVGIDFSSKPVMGESWANINMLSRADKIEPPSGEEPRVVSVCLPLLAQVLTTWLELVAENDLENTLEGAVVSRKVVMLISGSGKPRNRDLDIHSNSTKGAAMVMADFIKRQFSDVELELLDSGLGVFHYDQNVQFCNDKLLPAVEKLRHPLVESFGDEWKQRLRVTIALTDGSPARLAALNAALRHYKPNYLHMWQLKTFWYEHKFFREDLLFQSFETMETRPPKPYAELDDHCRALVNQMRLHKLQFQAAKESRSLDELSTFWLRKTRKCVLSVLMVQSPLDSVPRFFRGMNLEVSMPTGSLCSERNVVGTALASDPTLRRQDLRMIAVLSMTLDKAREGSTSESPLGSAGAGPRLARERQRLAKRPRSVSSNSVHSSSARFAGELNPIQPCGACNEWLKKIAEVNPTFKVITFPDSDCNEAFVREVS